MSKPFLFADSNSIPWRKSTFTEGVFVKDLGSSDGQAFQLVRFEPGIRFPWHQHRGPEFLYVIEGDAIAPSSRCTRNDQLAGAAPHAGDCRLEWQHRASSCRRRR
jgi:hypothetical protein